MSDSECSSSGDVSVENTKNKMNNGDPRLFFSSICSRYLKSTTKNRTETTTAECGTDAHCSGQASENRTGVTFPKINKWNCLRSCGARTNRRESNSFHLHYTTTTNTNTATKNNVSMNNITEADQNRDSITVQRYASCKSSINIGGTTEADFIELNRQCHLCDTYHSRLNEIINSLDENLNQTKHLLKRMCKHTQIDQTSKDLHELKMMDLNRIEDVKIKNIASTTNIEKSSQKVKRKCSDYSHYKFENLSVYAHDQLHLQLNQNIIHISKELNHLRRCVESFAPGSEEEQVRSGCVASVGRYCPKPNPELHLIRCSEKEINQQLDEYQSLCQQPLSIAVLEELKSVAFDNWTRTDAQLIRLVREMYVQLGLVKHYQIELGQFDLWLGHIYRRYNRVPFHNYKHAFMVTQMCFVLMYAGNLVKYLDKEDQLILLTSAICHDLDHPGFNNFFQINAGTELAIRYNDQSPLENHHSAMAFDILTHPDCVNPFSKLPDKVKSEMRKRIIKYILATDMSRHNAILGEFKSQILNDLENAQKLDLKTNRPKWTLNETQRDITLMILIKVCDISNEARPLHIAGPWIDCLLDEFFTQSDYEKQLGLPFSPFMDREQVTKAESQCSFIRFTILPLFESIVKLIPAYNSVILEPALEQLNYYSEIQNKPSLNC